MGLKRACGAFLSPLRWSAERRTTTPVPSSEEGNYGAGKQILSDLQAMVSTSRKPMVMVSGTIGLQEKGGRSPPPKRGRLGGGRCICDTLLSPSACSTEGFFVEKRLSYPAQQGKRKGFVKGESVPLDRVLLTFARTKVSPRRVGVQSITFYKTFPTGGDYKLFHAHLPVGGKRKKPGGTGLSLWTARPRAHPRLRSALRE